jgi:hypothetical protein
MEEGLFIIPFASFQVKTTPVVDELESKEIEVVEQVRFGLEDETERFGGLRFATSISVSLLLQPFIVSVTVNT